MSAGEPTPDVVRALKRAQKMLDEPSTKQQIVEARRALNYVQPLAPVQQRWAEALAPSVQRGVEATRRMLSQFDWSKVGDAIRAIGEALLRLLPTNLRELEATLWPELTRLAREEQLCLAWVPDVAVVRELLAADDAAGRDVILVARSDQVLTSCSAALAGRAARDVAAAAEVAEGSDEEPDVESEVPGVIGLVQQSIAAAQAGLFAPAQALATCVIDSVVTQYLMNGSRKVQSGVKRTLERSEEKQALAFVVKDALVAFESAYRQQAAWDRPVDGVPPYSRNATVHAARPSVYTTATAMKAVLLATSMVLVADHPLVLSLLDIINMDPEDVA